MEKAGLELLTKIFSEYGLAVAVLLVFLFFLLYLLREASKQRERDREERLKIMKDFIESQKENNSVISQNTKAMRRLESNFQYLIGMLHGSPVMPSIGDDSDV